MSSPPGNATVDSSGRLAAAGQSGLALSNPRTRAKGNRVSPADGVLWDVQTSSDDVILCPRSSDQQDPAVGLNRDSFRKWVMVPALESACLSPKVRTHDLRHISASLLISLGAHPKAIQERLGHSDIGVTLNLYGHLFPSLEEQLTDALDDLGRSVGRRDPTDEDDE